MLIVEDHQALRELIEAVLSGAGYKVMSAASGDEAVAIACQSSVDLLLTDIGMPGMNGQALVDRLHAQWSDLPVVFISGCDPESLPKSAPHIPCLSLQQTPR